MPENEPAGFSGTYDGFELMIVGTDDLFQAFFRHGFPDKSLGPIRHQFGFGMYDVQYRTVFVIEDEHIGNGIEHRAVQIGYFLGMTGMHGQYAASRAKAEADLIVAIGVRFSDRATGNKQEFAKNAKKLLIIFLIRSIINS